ncbi:hypothetical protein [Campylobacter sp. RM12651]|uniref:hypothetical protein n=1 Tax=Campylobacter sp. RM12651 TaxID=1660079 RepID=UPI001EFBB194|nr:hypothetical protein [Campylobacter sp. RM12651]ULO02930.1 hypothetical protein AVBRAN_0460 [Campylobacter sp. RM12651]
MGQYVDSNLLNMAKPDKNEWQAVGDGFKEMYNNYIRTRLSQNEIDLSDLRLGYERATQDDRIRAIKLGTENLENQVQKGAIDLDIARQTKNNKIAQEQIKTANDMETLKQNQFATKTQPEIFKMQKENHKVNLSNTYSIINERKQNMFFKDQAYKEQEEAKKVMSDFNEFSLKFPNLKGDDLKNGYVKNLDDEYNYTLNNPLLNDSQRVNKLSEIHRKKINFAKYLPQTAQTNSIITQGFSPYSKGGNGANATSGIDTNEIFNNLNKEKLLKEEINKNNKDITNIKNQISSIRNNHLISDEEKAKQIQELDGAKKDLENKNNTLMNYQNTIYKSDLSDIYKILETKTSKEIAKDAFTNLENLKEVKNLINKAAYLSDKVGWFGINNKIYSVAANMVGSTFDMKELESVMTQIKARLSAEKGKTLSKEYQNLTKLVDDPTTFANNLNAFRQSLSSLDDYIIGQALNIGDSYGNDVKNLVSNVGGFNKKVRDDFNSEDNEINLVLKQYTETTSSNKNPTNPTLELAKRSPFA